MSYLVGIASGSPTRLSLSILHCCKIYFVINWNSFRRILKKDQIVRPNYENQIWHGQGGCVDVNNTRSGQKSALQEVHSGQGSSHSSAFQRTIEPA